jgi:hypothetical protein
VKLPVAPAQYDPGDQARLRGALERADDQSLKRGVALPFLLLASANGTVWKGVIDNAGALSWTALP